MTSRGARQTSVADKDNVFRGDVFRASLLSGDQSPLILGVPVRQLCGRGERGKGLGKFSMQSPAFCGGEHLGLHYHGVEMPVMNGNEWRKRLPGNGCRNFGREDRFLIG
jgi:hypothetical protein